MQPRELCIEEKTLIRDNQQTFENKSKFKVLKNKFNIIRQNNILKCEDRLKTAPITTDAKLPKFVNCNPYLAELIVWDVHLKLKHTGCKEALTEIRQKFWWIT